MENTMVSERCYFDRAIFSLYVPAVGFTILTSMTWVYVNHPDLYQTIMEWWMGDPWTRPFLDLQNIPASIRCWDQGINVYVQNPCDALNRLFNYSPLWLRASFLSGDWDLTDRLGLGLVGIFLLSLGAIPQPRLASHRFLILLATFSCLPVYAIERGNIDLLIFILALVSCLCLGMSPPGRIVGYGIIITAGLLKFYPFVLLIHLLRERLKVFIGLALVAFVVIVGFGVTYSHELRAAIQNIVPTSDPFSGPGHSWFGASRVINGFSDLALHHFGTGISAVLHRIFRSLLTLGAILTAWRIGTRRQFGLALAVLPARGARFLTTGALLICGCFFTGPSGGYRGFFLLFAFSSVLGLAWSATVRHVRAIFVTTALAMFYVLWSTLIQQLANYLSGDRTLGRLHSHLGMAAWFVGEAAWWWIAIVLTAVIFHFGLTSRAWGDLVGSTQWQSIDAFWTCIRRALKTCTASTPNAQCRGSVTGIVSPGSELPT
jgi:hypothetical protein